MHVHTRGTFFPPAETAKAINKGWFLIRKSCLSVFLPLAQGGVREDGGRRRKEDGEGLNGRSQASGLDLSSWHLAGETWGRAGELASSCIIDCLILLLCKM